MDKTFLKGLALLETLARAEKPVGVTELARDMELTKSNVHRLLQALVHCGFARKSEATSQYELTMKLWELSTHVFSRLDVQKIASPYLQELARHSSETVHLSILDNGEVVYIDNIDSPHPVRTYSKIGQRVPSYCVATGKALLAWQPRDIIEQVGGTLQRHTQHTVADMAELDSELAKVRQAGYAINKGEWRDSVCGVAAPIRDARGAVIAAVGLSGPAERLKRRTMRELAPVVMDAADAISHELGYRGQVQRHAEAGAETVDQP